MINNIPYYKMIINESLCDIVANNKFYENMKIIKVTNKYIAVDLIDYVYNIIISDIKFDEQFIFKYKDNVPFYIKEKDKLPIVLDKNINNIISTSFSKDFDKRTIRFEIDNTFYDKVYFCQFLNSFKNNKYKYFDNKKKNFNKKTFSIEEIENNDKFLSKRKSIRKKGIFIQKNKCCKHCGREGTKYIFTKGSNLPRLMSDDYILLTIDHMIPKSLGGSDEITNYQVLCECCNSLKSSMFLNEIITFNKVYYNTDRESYLMLSEFKNAGHIFGIVYNNIHTAYSYSWIKETNFSTWKEVNSVESYLKMLDYVNFESLSVYFQVRDKIKTKFKLKL